MNYKKVIKDLKQRNDKLQEQYRLRDIRCIHLEYENEMLKSDFEAQHELTKKYAEENQALKKQLEERPKEYVFIGNAQNKTRDFINQITKDNKELKNQQKEFIEMLEKEIVDSKAGSGQQYYAKEHLSKYKEIIGVSNE